MSSSSYLVISLRTSNGRYLGVHNGKVVAIATAHPVPGEAVHLPVGHTEGFGVRFDADGRVSLRTKDRRYLGVAADGRVVVGDADQKEATVPDLWVPIETPRGIVLQHAVTRRFLSPRGGGGGDVELAHARRGYTSKEAWTPSEPIATWPRPAKKAKS